MTEMFGKRGFLSINLLCKAYFVNSVNLIKALTYNMVSLRKALELFCLTMHPAKFKNTTSDLNYSILVYTAIIYRLTDT